MPPPQRTRCSEASLQSLSPPPCQTFFKKRRRKLFIPGLRGWKHRQMAPELATWQTQKVLNTISSKQPRTSPSSAKCGELHWEPFLALWSPSPLILTQASCQPEAEVRLGPRGSREEGQRWLTAAVHTPAEQGWCRDCLPSLGQHFSAPWASRWGQVALLSNGMWVGMIWPLWAELVDDLVT